MTLTKQEALKVNESALRAAALLGLFLERKWELTESELDGAMDCLIQLLEECRDESYRTTPDPTD